MRRNLLWEGDDLVIDNENSINRQGYDMIIPTIT